MYIFNVQMFNVALNNSHAYNHNNVYYSFRLTFRFSAIAFDNREKITKFNSIDSRHLVFGTRQIELTQVSHWLQLFVSNASAMTHSIHWSHRIENYYYYSLSFTIYDAFRAYLCVLIVLTSYPNFILHINSLASRYNISKNGV